MDLEVKIVPSSGCQKIVCDKNGTIKIFLKSPPEDGKANRELVRFLAKTLRALSVVQDDITILLGITSRKKRLRIHTGRSCQDVLNALGLEVQHAIF